MLKSDPSEEGFVRVMVIGVGDLGGRILDLCLRLPGHHEFVAVGRDDERVRERANVSALTALQLGSEPHWATDQIDLWNEDRTAELIDRHRPDVIVCSVIFWVHNMFDLPGSLGQSLYEAQIGPWTPMNLVLPMKLMRAVTKSGHPTKVVQVSNPDIVNPVLLGAGLSPTTGIGQVSNSVPGLRTLVARQLGLPVNRVDVRLFAGHFVAREISRNGTAGGAPYALRAFADGREVTDLQVDQRLFPQLGSVLRRTPGNTMAAASAAAVIDGLINDTRVITHAPGPNGLPGGYPIRVSTTGVEVVLPEGMTIEDAIDVNERCQPFDGIEQIESDGTVHFTEREMGILTEMFGYECRRMPVGEVEARAEELQSRFSQFVASLR